MLPRGASAGSGSTSASASTSTSSLHLVPRPLLRLVIRFENHLGDGQGDDVGADLAELLVLVAGTVRLDAALFLEDERDGHLPAVGAFDLAADGDGVVIIADALHVPRVDDGEGLVEDIGSTPPDDFLTRNPGLDHGGSIPL